MARQKKTYCLQAIEDYGTEISDLSEDEKVWLNIGNSWTVSNNVSRGGKTQTAIDYDSFKDKDAHFYSTETNKDYLDN